MYKVVITILFISSCLIFSACYAGGYSSSHPAKHKNSKSDWEWELNTETSELELCSRDGIVRICL